MNEVYQLLKYRWSLERRQMIFSEAGEHKKVVRFTDFTGSFCVLDIRFSWAVLLTGKSKASLFFLHMAKQKTTW